MKILYVTTISNTVNAFLIPHIKILINKGHKVDVAFNIEQSVKEDIYTMGCNVYKIDFNRSPLKNNFKSLVNKIRNIVLDGDYDLVHTHTPIASAVVRIACRNLNNVKIFYTAHGFHFYDGAPLKNWLIYYPIERILSKYTDILITINEEDYKRAKKLNAGDVKLMNGVGIDLNKYTPGIDTSFSLRRELNLTADDIILLSVGELNNNKNHQIIIRALAKLNNNRIHYVVAGEGENKKFLSDLAEKLNLSKQIHLLGFRSNIVELYRQVNIFVFPSYREGLSASLMEAMASGLPVICSDIRGNKDLVDDYKGGYLVKNQEINDYSEKITELCQSIPLRNKFGQYNQEKIQQYSIRNVLDSLKTIYREHYREPEYYK